MRLKKTEDLKALLFLAKDEYDAGRYTKEEFLKILDDVEDNVRINRRERYLGD